MLEQHQHVLLNMKLFLPTNVSKWYGCMRLFANKCKCSPIIVHVTKMNKYCSLKDLKTHITTLILSLFVEIIQFDNRACISNQVENALLSAHVRSSKSSGILISCLNMQETLIDFLLGNWQFSFIFCMSFCLCFCNT